MNDEQLVAIRDAVNKGVYQSYSDQVLALLSELERKWRQNEQMDAQINEVRRLAANLEWAVRAGRYPSADQIVIQLREIVGPR